MNARFNMRRAAALCAALLCLLSFSARAEIRQYKVNDTKVSAPLEEGYISDTEYRDPSIHVVISEGREYDTDYLVIRISMQNGTQIRTALESSDGKATGNGITIAKKARAVFAMNGDFFRENKKSCGKYVVRQGKLKLNNARGELDVLLIDENGGFHILLKPKKAEIKEYIEQNSLQIVNSFSFGPALMLNGELLEIQEDRAISTEGPAQRTALCRSEVTDGEYQLEYVCVVSAGPDNTGSTGMTLSQFSSVVAGVEGVTDAYNLDGGSSAIAVFRGTKINTFGLKKNRPISDIVCFCSAYAPD